MKKRGIRQAQWIYENLPVSGRVLWSRLVTEGRLPQICNPAEGEEALARLGKTTMDRIGQGPSFVFRFHDRSQLVVHPYSIEAQWNI